MDTKIDFEAALQRLEELSDRLESGDIPLDDAMKLFEEGIKLSKWCEKKLNDTEQKIEILNNLEISDSDMGEPKVKKNKTKSVVVEKKDSEENFLF